MKKTVTYIFIVTFIALMYVNEQAIIYQMGMRVKENQDIYSKLVDHNKILVYNVLNLRSPVNLERKLLAREVELSMPAKWQVLKVKNSPEKSFVSVYKEVAKKGLFANLFVSSQ